MINVEPHPDFPNIDLLEHAARVTLEHQSDDPDVDLSIVLTDDDQLRELNRDYLGIDSPTDVLSFPASESDPETGARYLGDILISIPRAAEQANAAGHDIQEEVQLPRLVLCHAHSAKHMDPWHGFRAGFCPVLLVETAAA